MSQEENGSPFQEVFDLIEEYASKEESGAYEYHLKALDLVAGTYVYRFEGAVPPDARRVVGDILERHDFMVRDSGRGALEPVAVDAVVAAALVAGLSGPKDGIKWGTRTLHKILDAVVDSDYASQDPDMLADDTVLVANGLKKLTTFYQPMFEGSGSVR